MIVTDTISCAFICAESGEGGSTDVLTVSCIYSAHLAASPELSLLCLSLVSSGPAADAPEQLVAAAI